MKALITLIFLLIMSVGACKTSSTERKQIGSTSSIAESCRQRGGFLDVAGNCVLNAGNVNQNGVWYPGLMVNRTNQTSCLAANQTAAGQQYPNRYRWVTVQNQSICLDVKACLEQAATSPAMCNL